MAPQTNIKTSFNNAVDIAILYDELIQLCETNKVSELVPVFLTFVQQNLAALDVDSLEDMKTFLFNLIEEIDGTIQMATGGPSTTRE